MQVRNKNCEANNFLQVLIQEEVHKVKDLFDTGTLGPKEIVDMFGNHSSQFRMHLAIILLFTKFIETCTSGVVNLGSNPEDNAWILTVRKSF